MAFRPDTTYKINNTTYPTFYKALIALKNMDTGTEIKDGNNRVVFRKDDNANDFYLYQFNDYITKASNLSYSRSDLISGCSTLDNESKMLTWLNNYRYSKAIDGTGAMSNSRSTVLYKHNAVSLKDVYTRQEKISGGYYAVRSLSSAYDGKSTNAAKVTVTLSGIGTNLTSLNNAYFFLGIRAVACGCEIGLQLRKVGSGYKWYVVKNVDSGQGYNTASIPKDYPFVPIADSINTGKDVTLEMIKVKEYLHFRVIYDGRLWTEDGTFTEIAKSGYTTRVPANGYYGDGKAHEVYRSVSLCPSDSSDPGVVATDLNSGEYFKGVAFKDCSITRGTSSDTYENWPYNSAINQYAVAFNDEFIDVTPSTEKVNISYKGRDNNDKLIIT